jgi:hypothetical protein
MTSKTIPADFDMKVFYLEPKLAPWYGRPGYPVRGNVKEVNGRFVRIRKWIPGIFDKWNGGFVKVHWDETPVIDWPKEDL